MFSTSLKEARLIASYRELVFTLVTRDLKARYRNHLLGFLWSLMNPLLLTLIYTLVFSVYLRVDLEAYSYFLLSGLLPWTWFTNSLMSGMQSILGNPNLIKSVSLPAALFPLVQVLAHCFHFLASLPILLLIGYFFGIEFTLYWAYLPLLILLQIVFSYGLGLCVACVAVRFRDMEHIIQNLVMFFFFVTPIMYPITQIPEKYVPLTKLNPFLHLVQPFQDIFYYHQAPQFESLMILSLLGLAALLLGLNLSRRSHFAEFL